MHSPASRAIPKRCLHNRDECASTAAQRMLRSSGYPALARVTCEVVDGVVVLRGVVPSYYLKQLAQVIVQRLEKIGAVRNLVEVQ